LVCSLDEAEHLSRINDVLVRGEKQEPFSRCSNRRYAAANVSYEHEKARILEGMGKAGVAAHHLTAVLAVGVAPLSPSNRISADLPNAASIVAIERRPPNVDISGPVSANGGHPPIARRSRFGEGPEP
jgi:hypothetical protein